MAFGRIISNLIFSFQYVRCTVYVIVAVIVALSPADADVPGVKTPVVLVTATFVASDDVKETFTPVPVVIVGVTLAAAGAESYVIVAASIAAASATALSSTEKIIKSTTPVTP